MLEYRAIEKKTAQGSGIAAYLNRKMVVCIADIAPDHHEITRLAERLNCNEVSLLHFYDVVEDYVAER